MKTVSSSGGSSTFWVDALIGDILFYDTTLDIYEDVYARDHDSNGQATYDCAQSIFRRLDIATCWYARYYEDQTTFWELYRLTSERVFYHIGHGTAIINSDIVTVITTEDGYIIPADVESKDLSGMDLAFLCTCWSAADDYPADGDGPWSPVDKSIAEGFLDSGAKCVFGWDESVLKVEAQAFSRYFFDYAVNEKNFEACFIYAISYVDDETADMARMDGDDSLHLDEEDYGSDSWLGTSLGSGYDIWFYVNDEGLWRPDIDWFYFGVYGSRECSYGRFLGNQSLT